MTFGTLLSHVFTAQVHGLVVEQGLEMPKIPKILLMFGVVDLQVIGPLYFAHGPAVLEAVFASVEEWPAPCPGALCPLPFLSETIMFQVPEIDMPPQVASKYK